MPRDRGRPPWHGASVLALVVVIAVGATLLGIYVFLQWEQPPAVTPQEPVLDERAITPQQ